MKARLKAPKWPSEVKNAAPGEVVVLSGKGGAEPKKTKKRKRGMGIVKAATIKPKPVKWLWEPYVAENMITMIDGDPGAGKSYLMCAMATQLSTGQKLPGQNFAVPPSNVLIMTTDDSLESTIVPRLLAMGADMDNVWLLPTPEEFNKEQLQRFEEDIKDNKIKVAFVDPLFSFIGNVDINKANEATNIMKKLARIADEYSCAIVPIRHLRKSGTGGGPQGPAIYQGVGSISILGQARSVIMVLEVDANAEEDDPDYGKRAVLHIKNNVGPKGPPFTYYLDRNPGSDQVFRWGGVADFTYEDLKGGPKKRDTKKKETNETEACQRALWDMFIDQEEWEAKEAMEYLTKKRNFSERTVQRARRGIVQPVKSANKWYWQKAHDAVPPEAGDV